MHVILKTTIAAGTALALLSACAQTPHGPRVQAMPGANKSFEAYAQDQEVCKQYAKQQVEGQADNANERALGATVIGGLLGTGVGAVLGGGRGAAVGAAVGGVGGAAVGTGASSSDQRGIQQQYDNAYTACMSAKGNAVAQPVYVVPQPVYVAPPPPAVYYAPPPGAAVPPPGP